MAHRYAENVVGGIEEPRFLFVGDELSLNVSFEDDTTGVSESTGGVIAREFDETTPWGDYVLTIEDDDTGQYASVTVNTGAAIAGKRFIVTAWARNDAAEGDQIVYCVFNGLTGTHEKEFILDQNWLPVIVHEVVVPAGAAGNNLVYRIYPRAKAQTTAMAKIRVDKFRCREVVEEFELPVPMRGNLEQAWSLVNQAEIELIDGSKRRVLKGVRYRYESTYEKLTAAQEVLRSKLLNTSREVMLFPHKDAPIVYFVQWHDEYERNHAFGIAAHGHEGSVMLEGTEVLPEMPVDVIDELNEYEFEDDALYFERIGDSFVYAE